ncbi:MAG: class I SAM-dependent rRNA methyltransferase [Rhodospirillum sp.]|nr:class I SAM-dependent rRNA methyltransferase [Rhodospirillum sp.]MCF8488006.1 class I SAM-dependent rRNA methyltransferase [Rhodospirillum sp.]MCF8503216.1 class I SAM-dependent rRNA methyltransferase [Rhodospirillum sp.]
MSNHSPLDPPNADPRPILSIAPGRSKRLRQGHPWLFSNEVVMTTEIKALPAGSLVTVQDAGGESLGVATFSPHSLIAARLLDERADAAIDRIWVGARLHRALALRAALFPTPHGRLIHGEADQLPGLIVDRLGDVLAVQANTAGMDRLTEVILDALEDRLSPRAIVLINNSPVRALEGLPQEIRLARGALDGPVPVEENGFTYLADLLDGQKTGWFFDQRPNRAFVANLAKGRSVLDAYTYAGGFGLLCLARGATAATLLDRSEHGLDLARRTAEAAGLADRLTTEKAEAFSALERMGNEKRTFGVVICDPPAFAKSRKDVAGAAKGYRKVARLAAPLVEPGGFLFLASCSHHMPTDRFQDESAKGIAQAGRTGRILRSGGAGPDHPIHPALPESAYLKTLTWVLD